MFGGGGSLGTLEEIHYCAYGCFSSVVAVLCIKHDVLLTKLGWMLPGFGFPFSVSLWRQLGEEEEEEEGGCSATCSLPFFPSPRHKGQDEPRGCRLPFFELFSASLQEEEKLVHPGLG